MSQLQSQSQSQSNGKTVDRDKHANELWRNCSMSYVNQNVPVDEVISRTNKVVEAYLANIACREVNTE